MLAAASVCLLAALRVILSFDDALKDHLLIAAPELEARGWRGVFNIVTDWVGRDGNFLTWEDVAELSRRGHEIVTHSKSHLNLKALAAKGDVRRVRDELARSRDAIADKVGVTPRYYCPPYVAQDAATERIAREEGLVQLPACRVNFGTGNSSAARQVVEKAIAEGKVRLDLLHHGVSAEDRSFTAWYIAARTFDRYRVRPSFCICGEFDEKALAFAAWAKTNGYPIALHGLRHRNADEAVARAGAEAYLRDEIDPQLAALAGIGLRPRLFAYPNCRRSEASDAALRSRGFTRMRGHCTEGRSPNPLDRTGKDLTGWEPIAKCDRMYVKAADFERARVVDNVILGEWYHTDIDDILAAERRAGERAEALVLVSHDIAPDAKAISMKTAWLEAILSSAAEAGVVIRGLL